MSVSDIARMGWSMSRDGEGSKDIRQRKRPAERREVRFNDRRMPQKRHPAVYTGMAFAILGGLMIAATFLVSWVDSYDSGNALVEQLFVWDMGGNPEWGTIYYLALLAPIAGAACAIVSGTALANERRAGLRRFAAMGVLATSVIAAIAISVLILLLKEQYIAEQLDRTIYGPAIFLSVFGCVLAISGGIVLMVDYLSSERKKGTFATAPGSKHLKSALKPVSRGQSTRSREPRDPGFHDKEIREEMLAEGSEEPDPAEDEGGLSCPSCQSPVKASWKQCPVCGEEFAD